MVSVVQVSRSGRAIRSPKVARKRERLRATLVAKSGQLFAERGVNNVSIADVLVAARTSRASFYELFANKAELIAAAMLPVFADAAEQLDRLARSAPADSINGVIDMYLRLWAEHSDALLLINDADQSVYPYIKVEHDRFIAGLQAVLVRAEEAGLLRNDSARLTHAVLARTGVALLRIYKNHPAAESLYRDSLISLLLKSQGETK